MIYQASKQARKQITLLTSYGGACPNYRVELKSVVAYYLSCYLVVCQLQDGVGR